MIQLVHVIRKYGDRTAVKGLSLEIPSGNVFAFLGPNGAGKTTTIKMMVGLLLPTEGRIRIAGYDIVEQPREAKSRIGYVPDQPDLYEKLSGREVLQFVAEMYVMDESIVAERTERFVDLFDLSEFIDQLTENYSHGMKQRVAFAAALLHQPDVLVLDEPMVGLDPRSMRMVKDLLRHEARAGMTVFMSTHTLTVAEEVADIIGVINHGELLFLGTVAELREHLSDNDSTLEDLFLRLTNARDHRPELEK